MEASLSPTAPSRTECIPHHEEVEQISVSVSRAGEAPWWLMSRLADFWLVCAGGGVALLVVAGVLVWRGDRELSIADLLLSELHLGATYGVIVRRRLWQRMPVDVVAVPVIILLATYAITLHGWRVLLVTSIVYVGAWHRTRQNLGIARHYQRLAGGPRSRVHGQILAAAMYLPMAAAVAYFTSTSPYHEGEEFIAVPLPACVPWILAALAAIALILYLGSETARVGRYGNWGCPTVHPAERWLVDCQHLRFRQRLRAWRVDRALHSRSRAASRGPVPCICVRDGESRSGASGARCARESRAARVVCNVAGGRCRQLGALSRLGSARNLRAVSDGRAARTLLVGWTDLDGTSAPAGGVISFFCRVADCRVYSVSNQLRTFLVS